MLNGRVIDWLTQSSSRPLAAGFLIMKEK